MKKTNTDYIKKNSYQIKYTQNREIKTESSQPTNNRIKTGQVNFGYTKKYNSSQKNIFNNNQKKNEFISNSSIRNKYQAPEEKKSLNISFRNNKSSYYNRKDSYFSSKDLNSKYDSNNRREPKLKQNHKILISLLADKNIYEVHYLKFA